MFFTKAAVPLFAAWERLVYEIDSSAPFLKDGRLWHQPFNDQAGFAAAVE
jgi:hypothetical protein